MYTNNKTRVPQKNIDAETAPKHERNWRQKGIRQIDAMSPKLLNSALKKAFKHT